MVSRVHVAPLPCVLLPSCDNNEAFDISDFDLVNLGVSLPHRGTPITLYMCLYSTRLVAEHYGAVPHKRPGGQTRTKRWEECQTNSSPHETWWSISCGSSKCVVQSSGTHLRQPFPPHATDLLSFSAEGKLDVTRWTIFSDFEAKANRMCSIYHGQSELTSCSSSLIAGGVYNLVI